MTYVVTETCIRCKYTDCVDVCPVDCFREGPNFLVIDPDECIDCTLCVAECPVEAIYAEDDVPDDQKDFTALNAELAKLGSRSSNANRRRPMPTTGRASRARRNTWNVPKRAAFDHCLCRTHKIVLFCTTRALMPQSVTLARSCHCRRFVAPKRRWMFTG